MKTYYHLKNLCLYFLTLLLGVSTLYAVPGAKKTNYYLGVLANGYPHSMVISEFRYASAEVVNIRDNLVLFGINENTKLTTFLKNLPFLEEVYVDAEGLKGKISLNANPLAREFLFLLQPGKTPPEVLPHLKNPDHQDTGASAVNSKSSAADTGSIASKGPTLEKGSPGKKTGPKNSENNMALIDKLIREKAKKNSAKQGAVK